MRLKAIVLLSASLVGCGAPPRSVDWYSGHPEAAVDTTKRCSVGAQSGAECQAAAEAIRRRQDDRLKQFRRGF